MVIALTDDDQAWVGYGQADLLREELDGQTYWFSASAQQPAPQELTAWLLPEYDEAIWFRSLGFPDMDWVRDSITWNNTFFRPIVIGGRRGRRLAADDRAQVDRA